MACYEHCLCVCVYVCVVESPHCRRSTLLVMFFPYFFLFSLMYGVYEPKNSNGSPSLLFSISFLLQMADAFRCLEPHSYCYSYAHSIITIIIILAVPCINFLFSLFFTLYPDAIAWCWLTVLLFTTKDSDVNKIFTRECRKQRQFLKKSFNLRRNCLVRWMDETCIFGWFAVSSNFVISK